MEEEVEEDGNGCGTEVIDAFMLVERLDVFGSEECKKPEEVDCTKDMDMVEPGTRGGRTPDLRDGGRVCVELVEGKPAVLVLSRVCTEVAVIGGSVVSSNVEEGAWLVRVAKVMPSSGFLSMVLELRRVNDSAFVVDVDGMDTIMGTVCEGLSFRNSV